VRHARKDYNRIQDPAVNDPSLLSEGSTAIAEDEPVFLLRARDVSAPELVRHWADEFKWEAADEHDEDSQEYKDALTVFDAVQEWAVEMERWQQKNGYQTATVPLDQLENE